MGLTKADLFTERQNRLSNIAKALAHPARIAILEQILASEKCINTSLVSELGLAQATISQHLKELKSIGIIQGTIEGTSMCYCINSDVWRDVQTMITTFFESHTDNCVDDCC